MRSKTESGVVAGLATVAMVVGVLLAGESALAQNAPPPPEAAVRIYDMFDLFNRKETWISLLVFLFGVVVIFASYLMNRRIQFNGDQVIRLLSVTLIVVGTLFVVSGSYQAEDIAPVLGLFGTMAGYLLGRSDRASNLGADPAAGALPASGPSGSGGVAMAPPIVATVAATVPMVAPAPAPAPDPALTPATPAPNSTGTGS